MKVKHNFFFTSLVTVLLTINGCSENISESDNESNTDNFKNQEYRDELISKYQETQDPIYMEKVLQGYKNLISEESNYPPHYFNRCQLYALVDLERASKECHVALIKINKFQVESPEETLATKYDIVRTLCLIYILKKEYSNSDRYCLEAKNIFQSPTMQNLWKVKFGELDKQLTSMYLDNLINSSKKRSNKNLMANDTVCQTSPDSKLCQDVKDGSL